MRPASHTPPSPPSPPPGPVISPLSGPVPHGDPTPSGDPVAAAPLPNPASVAGLGGAASGDFWAADAVSSIFWGETAGVGLGAERREAGLGVVAVALGRAVDGAAADFGCGSGADGLLFWRAEAGWGAADGGLWGGGVAGAGPWATGGVWEAPLPEEAGPAPGLSPQERTSTVGGADGWEDLKTPRVAAAVRCMRSAAARHASAGMRRGVGARGSTRPLGAAGASASATPSRSISHASNLSSARGRYGVLW